MKTRRIAMIPALVLILAACANDQRAASYGRDVDMGNLPLDICYVKGVPQILSVSIENEEDIDIAYLDEEGRMVVQKYGTGLSFSYETKMQGRLMWNTTSTLKCERGL